MGETIELTQREIRLGCAHGVERVLEDFFKGETYAYGYDRQDQKFDDSISGTLGEFAFCKFANRYPSALTAKGADDTAGYEIRTIRERHKKLLLRENDTGIFVLVIDERPMFEVIGWIEAAEGKKEEFLYQGNGRPKCWLVPQDYLKEFKRNDLRRKAQQKNDG